MKNRILMQFSLLMLLMAAGMVSAATAQSVSGSIGNGTVTRGSAARTTVVLMIPGGQHANSNRPGSQYAIPTTVRATSTGAKIGAVSYPRGTNRKFAFSEETLNVYEGRPAFTFTVTVPPGFKGNSIAVRVVVKYQACTEEVCFPPKTKEITLTARVK